MRIIYKQPLLALAIAIIGCDSSTVPLPPDTSEVISATSGDVELPPGSQTPAVPQLINDFQEKENALYANLSSLPRGEMAAYYRANRPDVAGAAAKLLDIVTANPTDPATMDAAIWVVQHGMLEAENTMHAMLDVVREHHMDSSELGKLCLMFARGPFGNDFLRELLAKTPHDNVKAIATFMLSRNVNDEHEEAEMLQRVLDFGGPVQIEDANITEMAERRLWEIENLGIGKVAPDIEGEDVLGDFFKLSDHRGKVVLLDFWGDW